MKKFLALTVLAGAVLFSPAPQAADFDRVYETGTPLKAPRAMPNFRELKHALKMPQFDLKTIYGKNVNLADYKGKVVVLNVWATWCRPCVAEIPELITAQNALKNSDVRVIGVPFAIIFTKGDKLGPNALKAQIEKNRQILMEEWEELPPVFSSSSETGEGRDEILDYIEQYI